MELNQIKLLNKEELQWRLKQGGFDEVAKILEDKNVDGKTLMELKEFEIFKWKLNQFQKRNLWNCIRQIKDKPAILMIKEKPKVKNKPLPIKGKPIERVEPNKIFKNKLQDLLSGTENSVGSSSTLPKVGKSKPLPSFQNESKTSNKPLPPPPPPSPPPRNGVKNTNAVTKRAVLSLPKPTKPESSNDMTDDYLQMNAPPRAKDQGSNGDYYLSPIEVSVPSKNKSPNLTKKRAPNELIPRNVKPDECGTSFRSVKPTTNSSFTKAHSLLNNDVEETYDNPDNTYELSPPLNKENSNRLNNVPRGKSPLKIASDQDIHNYKQSPADSSTRDNSVQKSSIKDLGNHVIVVDENIQETKFSFFSSKLNIFKMKNKSKNLYENYNIQGAQQQPVEIPVKNRPLPEIPSSPRARPATLFSRPFPPPRDISPDSSSQDNYVELVPEQPSTSQGTEEPDDENQIYENTSTLQDPEQDAEDEQLIYENTSKTQNYDNDEDIYENTSNVQEPILKPPTTLRTKKYVGGTLFNQVLPTEFKGKPPTEDIANENPTAPKSSVQDLASLLSQQLMEIKQKQYQEQMVESETDSEFDYDDDNDVSDQIYGNILNDDENSQSQILHDQITEVAVSDNRYGNSSHVEDRRIPFYKRALPEIPRNNTPPNIALKIDSSSPPPPNKRGAISKTQLTENRNFNSLAKGEKSVNRNSTLEVPRPIYSSYEDHTMKRAEAGGSKEKERDGFDNIFDVSKEPFYRNTTRKGAKQLLSKSGSGIFLIRPSRTYFLVLTVKHNNRIYNFGIERTNNKLRLNTEGNIKPPEFSTLRDFVTYFMNEPVTFENGDELIEIYLKTYLPPDSS